MFEVKVLGPGCANCQTTYKLVNEVLQENAIPANVEKVEDMAQIMSYGIMSTPGVVVDGKIAHAGGTPDKKTILSWFKSRCCPTDENCC
ncbi:thioredoxin family protein [Candidatus Albibeggiatoa sp. nov. NOAA]|uniref:thioredoxin family protein n=1 Tax=Candidatus Albibeggiatoa sp. nov. NOAA TaxID=3162724 RepID=UPI0032FBE412|nr:thioredoxin family protein [Thiotrichaceae bacterium]